MKKFLRLLLCFVTLLPFLSAAQVVQVHTPTLERNNTWTGLNTFSGGLTATTSNASSAFNVTTDSGCYSIGTVADTFLCRESAGLFRLGATAGTSTGSLDLTTLLSNTINVSGISNGINIGSHTSPGFIQFSDFVAGHAILTPAGKSLSLGSTIGGTDGTFLTSVIDAKTGFRVNGLAPLNHVLLGNGTNYVDASSLALASVGAPTGTGFAHTTSGAWDGASKLVSLTAATDVAANQGTTTTVLHGNAAGNPAFGSVVSADLNITPTTCTNQFLTATSSTATGTCATATLASAQFANQGATNQVLHGNAAGNPSFAAVAPSDAAGNTSGTGSFALTTGAALSGPSTTGTDSGTEVFQNKYLTPRQIAQADATSITANAGTTDIATQVNTQAGGTLTLNAPTGGVTDGQKLILRIKTTNAQTYSFNAAFRFSTTTVAPTTIAAGKTDYIGCIWNGTDAKWDVVAVDQGH
jgi:hypothetical protein